MGGTTQAIFAVAAQETGVVADHLNWAKGPNWRMIIVIVGTIQYA